MDSPPRQWLDAAVPERPALLLSADGCVTLLNSKALEAAAIVPGLRWRAGCYAGGDGGVSCPEEVPMIDATTAAAPAQAAPAPEVASLPLCAQFAAGDAAASLPRSW